MQNVILTAAATVWLLCAFAPANAAVPASLPDTLPEAVPVSLPDALPEALPASESDPTRELKSGPDPEPEPEVEALPLRSLPPLVEMVTSPFGNRRMPGWLSRRGVIMRDHNGLDIRARTGWPVLAFRAGTVQRAGPDGLSGIVVELLHDDGLITRYAHLEKVLCRKGERVATGATVGLVGCTGRTTGAHLHFGMLDAQRRIMDPLPLLEHAGEILGPTPEMIPEELTPQHCGTAVMRGPDGKPVRLGRVLKDLEGYTPPAIPAWGGR